MNFRIVLVLFLSFTNWMPVTPEGSRKGMDFWSPKDQRVLTWDEVTEKIKESEVVVWGEEHNDDPGHLAQLQLWTALTERDKWTLSLEMLEKDQSLVLADYLSGAISEKQFLQGTVHWNNFAKDYLPLVRHAKEAGLGVVPANTPRRYVNAIGKRGLLAYSEFSEEAMRYLPAAYTLTQMVEPSYEERLRQVFFGNEHGIGSTGMLLAQYAWDQGMAEAISRERFRSGRKIFHLNGRFHSDFGGGVVFRLRSMGHKVLVISAFPGKKEEVDGGIADLVFLTSDR